jgi:hypothetical protein
VEPFASRWPYFLLLAVCIAHGLSSLVLVGVHHGLGYDETVYLSQYNRVVPAGTFTAPRARGVPLLVAPVTLITASTAVTRLWLAFLSSALMFVGFRPWLRLVSPYVVPLAAALFSGLWVTIFYGYEAMPNMFVAVLAVPAAALAVLHLREPRRSTLIWLAVCVGAVALIRPSDGLYLGAALALVALIARRTPWRERIAVAVASGLGFVAGSAQWVVEAYTSFGGPVKRYHDALAEQGGTGLHFSLPLQAKALGGPILCREGCHPHTSAAAMAWWFLIPPLLVAGLFLARRAERLALASAAVVGLLSAAQYIFGIWYAAPRFLMPAYALLAIPCAAALVEIVRRLPERSRRAGLVVVLVLVAGQVLSQVAILRLGVLPGNNRGLAVVAAEARGINRQLVHDRSCAMAGVGGQPVAYRIRCKFVPTGVLARGDVPAGSVRVFISDAAKPPKRLAGWTRTTIPLPRKKHTYAYTPPPATA